MQMNYKVIDRDKYYRKGVFRHFSEDCKCSASITARIDVIMPVTVRMNHAIADGFLIANVFRLLEQEIKAFVRQ